LKKIFTYNELKMRYPYTFDVPRSIFEIEMDIILEKITKEFGYDALTKCYDGYLNENRIWVWNSSGLGCVTFYFKNEEDAIFAKLLIA